MEKRTGARVTLAFLALQGLGITSCRPPEAVPVTLNSPRIEPTSTYTPDAPIMNPGIIVPEDVLKNVFDFTDEEAREFELANESKKYFPELQPQNVYRLLDEDFRAISLRKFQRVPLAPFGPIKGPISLERARLLYLCEQTSVDESFEESTGLLNWPSLRKINQWPHPYHQAIDLDGVLGEGVSAADGGIVVGRVESDRGYGNHLIINHGRGRLTHYAHLSRTLVKVGDKVNKGNIIGMVGSTGISSGPHLHFEVIERDEEGCSFVNPLLLLP